MAETTVQYLLNGVLIRNRFLGIQLHNRGLNYGDGLFESMRYQRGAILFWEDHYFRLMASMRILRMEIPLAFSPEFLMARIQEVVEANGWQGQPLRIKLLVVRQAGGYYTPETRAVDYLITAEPLPHFGYRLNEEGLRVDLYKDFYKPVNLLSTLKSTSAQLYTLAGIYRKENQLDEVLLLNDQKRVVEALSSNIFMEDGDGIIYTPPLESGCLKGVMRKNIIKMLREAGKEVQEEALNPFALQKARSLFLTNAVKGISWVQYYRKKTYEKDLPQLLSKRLNAEVVLGKGPMQSLP